MSLSIEPEGDLVTTPAATFPPSSLQLSGQHGINLVPLSESHIPSLYLNLGNPAHAYIYRYMAFGPISDLASFTVVIKDFIANPAICAFAILSSSPAHLSNKSASGEETAISFLTYLNIAPSNQSIEIGSVLFAPTLQRTTIATEAIYLLMKWALEEGGYARVEWKANALNEPSRRAALRLGFVFEGVFRKHMVIKGRRRDSAWYSCTDDDWNGGVKAAIEAWLDISNFFDGKQVRKLEDFRNAA